MIEHTRSSRGVDTWSGVSSADAKLLREFRSLVQEDHLFASQVGTDRLTVSELSRVPALVAHRDLLEVRAWNAAHRRRALMSGALSLVTISLLITFGFIIARHDWTGNLYATLLDRLGAAFIFAGTYGAALAALFTAVRAFVPARWRLALHWRSLVAELRGVVIAA